MDLLDLLNLNADPAEDETPTEEPVQDDGKNLWIEGADKPFWIVEPHADDAYLSLGDFIQRNSSHVTILTVFSGTRKRGLDARRYAESVGAKWEGLGYVESDVGLSSDTILEPPLGRDQLPSSGTLILPLGILHPEHRALATLRREGDLSYLETPYQLRIKNQIEVYRLLFGRSIRYWSKPDWKRKFKYHDLFRDQSMFMHRNPPRDLSGALEILVK